MVFKLLIVAFGYRKTTTVQSAKCLVIGIELFEHCLNIGHI